MLSSIAPSRKEVYVCVQERYAREEIDKQEFLDKKKDLLS
jgi:hypothetical protein